MDMNKKVLLISENMLKTQTIINENVDGKEMTNIIYNTQETNLSEIIGEKLLRKIQNLIATSELIDEENIDYKCLLDNYIVDYLLNKTLSNLIIPIQFKIRNKGIMRTSDEKSVSSQISDVRFLQNYYNGNAESFASKLSKYLLKNKDKFVELTQLDGCEDGQPNLTGYANCPIFLGNGVHRDDYDRPKKTRY